jgi:hypothetical protein
MGCQWPSSVLLFPLLHHDATGGRTGAILASDSLDIFSKEYLTPEFSHTRGKHVNKVRPRLGSTTDDDERFLDVLEKLCRGSGNAVLP